MQVALVRQEAEDGGYSAAHHDNEVDEEHGVEALVSARHTRQSPVVELQGQRNRNFTVQLLLFEKF